jgi:hypothetical protein
MATTTARGVYHPTSGDAIAPLETHFAMLAASVNDRLPVYGKKAFTGPASTAGTVNIAVTFATAFTNAPHVTATIEGNSVSSAYAVTLHSVTTNGFNATVYRINGSTADANLSLNWIALGA